MWNLSHARVNRRTNSCMSGACDALFAAEHFAAMLSVSINTVRPDSRAPNSSTARTMPDNSRQLIGRRFSAPVNLN